MKIRSGFVSNSSSSSFAIFGICTDDETLIKGLQLVEQGATIEDGCNHSFDRTKAKFCSECGSPAYIEIPPEDIDLYTYFDNTKFTFFHDNYHTYVGVDLDMTWEKGKERCQDFYDWALKTFGIKASFMSGEYAC